VILSQHNRNLAREMVDNAPDGHILEVRPPKRSLDSNRYYWAVLGDISEQVVPGKAYEPSIWHEYLRALFLPERMIELPDGSIKMLEPSTSELNQALFSEYVEKVVKWALEHDVKFSENTRGLSE
jgi:NinB protein